MSLFGSLGKLFTKIFAFLKKLLKWLGPLIIIALIIIAIFFPYLLPVIWGFVTSAWAAVGGWISAAWGWLVSSGGALISAAASWVSEASFADVLKLATGAAVILNPEGVADAAGSLIETVVKAAAPLFPWLLGGLGLWILLRSRKDDPQVVEVRSGS